MLVLVIAFGHYEADDYGTMNQWLVAAPRPGSAGLSAGPVRRDPSAIGGREPGPSAFVAASSMPWRLGPWPRSCSEGSTVPQAAMPPSIVCMAPVMKPASGPTR